MNIIGHKIQREFLKKIAENDRLPQALLFSGENSLGKKRVALEFIKLLNSKTGTVPFEGLSPRIIEKGKHPDVILIEPKKGLIEISRIRDLEHSLNLRPYLSSFKSVIIDEAEKLNPQAQNCLLKTLEEPKGNVLFLLITSQPEMLFETVRSRCEILKFYPVNFQEMEGVMRRKYPSRNLKEIISLAGGRPGKAIEFLKNPQKFYETLNSFRDIQKMLDYNLFQRLSFIKNFFSRKKSLDTFLESFVRYLRTIFLEKIGVIPVFNGNHSKITRNLSLVDLRKMIENVENLKFLISSTNINQRLAFENLMVNL